jgi:DNA-binding response OmpR family regulator
MPCAGVEDNVAAERFATQFLQNNGSETTWAANANGAISELNDPR